MVQREGLKYGNNPSSACLHWDRWWALHFGDSIASVIHINTLASPLHVNLGNKCSVHSIILMVQMPCHAHRVQLMTITEPRFGMNSSWPLLMEK